MYAMNYAGQVLHNPRTDIQVLSAELKEESGQSPTLTFKVTPTHPLWSTFGHDAVMAIEREVELKEVESGEVLFRGRVRSVSMAMDGSKKIVCEGSLAYLNDTSVRPYKTYDTTEIDCPINAPAEADKLFLWFIDQHNAHVANRCERFRVGINAGINYGRLSRGTGSRPTTVKEMRDKLTKLCGGYFRVRYDDYGSLIDWLPSRGAAESAQAVELGQNLLDLSTGTDGKDIFTAIVPVGKAGEGEHEHDVTIDDGEQDGVYVAVSPDYYILGDAIVDKAKAERYGVIEKTVQYRDIADKKQLAEKAMAELAAARFDDAIEVSAFDLHYADKSIRPINFLERVSVESKPHGLSRMMLCVGRTIDVCDPTHTKYKFGAIASTLTKEGTSAQDDADAQQRRVTALSASTRTIAEDTKKTTIKVAEVDDRAVKADAKAEEAKKTVVKVEEQVTTATKKADAAASKVEEVSTKAEKAAQAVTTVVSDVKAAKAAATEAKETADAAKQAVDKLGNAFSTDADGAHVGAKQGLHTTTDSQGLHVMRGTTELATFTEKLVSLARTAKDAVIKLVGDTLKISAAEKTDELGTYQQIKWESESLQIESTMDFHVAAARIGNHVESLNRVVDAGFDGSQFWLSSQKPDTTDRVSANGPLKHLINALISTPWVEIGDNKCSVRWRVAFGCLFVRIWLAGGIDEWTSKKSIPKKWQPSHNGQYYCLTSQGGGIATVHLGGQAGDGTVTINNYRTRGYASGCIVEIPAEFD